MCVACNMACGGVSFVSILCGSYISCICVERKRTFCYAYHSNNKCGFHTYDTIAVYDGRPIATLLTETQVSGLSGDALFITQVIGRNAERHTPQTRVSANSWCAFFLHTYDFTTILICNLLQFSLILFKFKFKYW
jgi:hypothetical protein